MSVKIAVTDACIFIDLCDLSLIASFFDLDIEIHTSVAVFHELYIEQQQILQAYQSVQKLIVHNLKVQDYAIIQADAYPKSLSETDKSVLYLANKLNACVLSSDKAVRNYAKNKDISYHGMLWIFDQLIELKIISKKEATIKLKQLVDTNFVFRNNVVLAKEIEKRIRSWV